MERQKMRMEDPVFAAGSTRTATAKLAIKPAGLACTAELWLSKDGVTKNATGGVKAFTSTGVEQSVSFAVIMPTGGFAYQVLLDIYTEGLLLAGYEATEDVLVPWVSVPVITW